MYRKKLCRLLKKYWGVIVDVGTYTLPNLLVGVSRTNHVITSAWSPTIRW